MCWTSQARRVQVMCMAVPPAVKASLDGVLASWVCELPEALQLLERLQHTEMVRNRALPGASLATQLSTVAESDEEYSEMIAFVRMVNVICKIAGPELIQHASIHSYVMHYTVRAPSGVAGGGLLVAATAKVAGALLAC